MFKYLYPDLYVPSIYEIPYAKLLKRNINTLFFDVDNTLLPHYVPRFEAGFISFLAEISQMGFEICILSNGSKKRVELLMENLPYKYVYRACKPLLYGINKALAVTGASFSRCAVIGDQIFTDILVGKRKKVYTVLVEPVSKKDELIVRIKRGAENLVINEYKKSRSNVS
ncbi:MAG: YqeG family HAD IIIA-type phosphatase [Clostridiales bacterium]|jgi:HAD superfamily phosphatase (TIGR01668 family)|nr:YqeG family HAD IIIA-type phosphatase [Clostridiales bacterium]